MAEEVDAQRQAFMDELGMTYVELEEAAADQEKAPPEVVQYRRTVGLL